MQVLLDTVIVNRNIGIGAQMTIPARRVAQSTQLRNPTSDLSTDIRQKIYIAALEKQVIKFALRDVQFRSVCEAATGIPYDSFDPAGMSIEDIQKVVADDMVRGLSVTLDEARSLVQENWKTANPSQKEVSSNEQSQIKEVPDTGA